MKKSKLFKTIYKFYEEYKIFINSATLPDIKIEIIDNDEDAFSYFHMDDLEVQKYILYVKESLFDYNEKFTKSILFHEFTHLYDFLQYTKIFSKEDTRLLMNYCSEYNASKTELLCQLYNTNLDEIKVKKKLTKTLWYKQNNEQVNNYIMYPLADLLAIIEDDHNDMKNISGHEFAKRFVRSEQFAVYYFGKLDACKQYIQGTVLDMFKSTYPFYDNFNDLHNILNSKSNSTVEKIIALKEWTETYKNTYYKYFYTPNLIESK